MGLGLGASLSKTGLATPGIVTDSLVLKHNYAAGGVVPVSDGSAFFDGTDDYVTIAHDSSLNILNNQTISCWANNSNSGLGAAEYMLSRYRSSGEDSRVYAFFIDSAEKLVFGSSDDGESGLMTWTSDSAISNINTWNHYATTFASGTVKIYVNGVSIAITRSGETHSAMASEDVDMAIGSISEAGGGYWEGYICNVGVWSAVLTQPQIKSIMWKNYAGLTSSETTNLVSWWNLSANANDDHGSNNGTLT